MRSPFLLIVVVIAVGGLAFADSGLVAWWSFENSVTDNAGSNHGVQTGGTFVSGRIGQALALNGNAEHVFVAKDPSLAFGPTDSFTVAFWMKRNTALQGGTQDIVSKCGTSVQGWRIGLTEWGQSMRTYFGAGESTQFFVYGGFVDSTEWNHLAAVMNRTENTISIYSNGELSGTVPVTAELDCHCVHSNLYVGRRNTIQTFFYNGAVDELRIYNRVLSGEEIRTLAGATTPGGDILSVRSTSVSSVPISGTHPGITEYHYQMEPGDTIELAAPARVRDSVFRHWLDVGGDIHLPATISATMPEGSATFTAVYTPDIFAPVIEMAVPQRQDRVPTNSLIRIDISDSGSGVTLDTVRISLDDGAGGGLIYDGSNESAFGEFSSVLGVTRRSGSAPAYTFHFQPAVEFRPQQVVNVDAVACDGSGNQATRAWELTFTNRTFGVNHQVNGTGGAIQENPDIAVDGDGNLWVIWQQRYGSSGKYFLVAALKHKDAHLFEDGYVIVQDGFNHTNPSICVGADDHLFAAWSAGSNILLSSSVDGMTWTAPLMIAGHTPIEDTGRGSVSLAAQADGNIWLAYESEGVIGLAMHNKSTGTWTSIASSIAAGFNPEIAVDDDGNVYVVYTETLADGAILRGLKRLAGGAITIDSLGPASTAHPQSGVVLNDDVLHITWVNSTDNVPQVMYAKVPKSEFPALLVPVEVSDDTAKTGGYHPSIAVACSDGAPHVYGCNGPKVFIVWTCNRSNLNNNGDTDIYIAETGFGNGASNGFGSSILLNDDTGTAGQYRPKVGVDNSNVPFAVWVDGRSGTPRIYFAYATTGGMVSSDGICPTYGGSVNLENGTGIISVFIHPGVIPVDTGIKITQVLNPPSPPPGAFGVPWNFGPSGLTFSPTARITITFHPSEAWRYNMWRVYWYDTTTGIWRTDGISNIQYQVISSDIHAITFDTTHFTTFHLAGERQQSRSGSRNACGSTAWQAGIGVGLFWIAHRIALRRKAGSKRRKALAATQA